MTEEVATGGLTRQSAGNRWDLHYDSRAKRPLLRHGYWPVLASLTRRDFRADYRQSVLRTLWSVWQPLSFVILNGLVFHYVLNQNGGNIPYLVFVVSGILPFRYLSTGLASGGLIPANAALVTKAYFPKELLGLSVMTVALVDVGVLLTCLLALAELQHVGLAITLVALPVVLLLLLVTTYAGTLLVMTLTVFIRDLKFVVPTLVQLLFFCTPIMYEASRLPPALRWSNTVNPLAVIIQGVRDTVLDHTWPDWPVLGLQLVAMTALAAVSLFYLRALESHMADVA